MIDAILLAVVATAALSAVLAVADNRSVDAMARLAIACLVAVALVGRPVALAHLDDAAVDLARICVSEAGWTYDGDCSAIYSALSTRAAHRGVSWHRQARDYSSRVFDRQRSDARRWVAYLSPDLRQPRGWPSSVLSWERGRALWQTRLERARAIVAGEVESSCAEPPEHWGSRYGIDLTRAERAVRAGRWSRVDCGPTRNAFYSVRR